MHASKDDQNVALDVAYVANLARLQLSDDETTVLQQQMEQIVAYVDQISALDVGDVEPTSHAVPVTNVLREDCPTEGLDHASVMQNAPSALNGLFVVPKIVD